MDIFKFNPIAGSQTIFERGSIIKDLKSKLWIERYRDAGEFELIADVSSNLRSLLPEGSFISHVDTTEVMIVENHEIKEKIDGESEIKITGRSFEALLDDRIIGTNLSWPSDGQEVSIYTIPSGLVWNQINTLIQDHILASNLLDDNDALLNVGVMVDSSTITVLPSDPIAVERPLKKESLYKAVLELLETANLGLKTIRPGSWSPLATNGDLNLALVIHRGIDRSKQVTFSHSNNEIINAEYFYSTRRNKTSAFVYGKWLETMVHGTESNYNRKVMFLDASDLDENFSETPTGTDRTNIIAAMNVRGQQALAGQNNIALSKVEVSKTNTRYKYRENYDVGDLVSVEGNYNTSAIMRVIEYVEIEDENGESSYPTLAEV